MAPFDLFDQTANTVLAAGTYAEFKKRLLASDCRRCDLGAKRTRIVVDRGNPEAKILVIGEGPGREEDATGRAFVGRSGQLLDKILQAIGLSTETDCLIVNIVKCRAVDSEGQNRPPLPAEAATCLPYLAHQIALVAPRVILLLGATSLRHMDPTRRDFAMRKEAGRFLALPDFPGVEAMVLYHPAALLRNPELKADMWAHVRRLRARLDELGIAPAAASVRGARPGA